MEYRVDVEYVQLARSNCWTIKEIETIISSVENRSYLYDKKHRDYKHNEKKDYAWEEIANILKTKSAKQCKKKWNTLRIQQRRIIAQRIKRANNVSKKSHWHCYDRLQFLIPHMEWTCNKDDNSQETVINDVNIQEYNENSDDCSSDLVDDNTNSTQIVNINEITKQSNDNTQEISSSSIINVHQNEESSSQLYNVQLHKFKQQTNANSIIFPAIQDCNEQQEKQKYQPQLSTSSAASSTSTNTSYLPIITKTHNQYDQFPSINNVIVNKSPENTNDNISFNTEIANKTKCHTNNHDFISRQQSTVKKSPNTNELNYFLLDLQQQMARLDDIQQMELKIEIQQLLLNKMRNN